jgi:cytochrome c oxidase assembly factor CtaG
MSNRAVRVAWPALTIVVAVAALVGVLALAGDVGQAALRTGRPIARLAMMLAASGTLGLLAAAALQPEDARRERLLTAAGASAAVQTVATGLSAFLLYLGDAPSIGSASFGPGLVTFLLELGVGRAWLAATVVAAVLSAIVLAARSRRAAAVALLLALAALVPVALQASASGDTLAETRSAVAAAGLRTAGLGVALGLSVVAVAAPATSRAAGRWVAAAAAVALVGAGSTALLRAGLLSMVDAVVLLLAAAAGAVALAPRVAGPASAVRLAALAVAAGIGAAPALTDPVRPSVLPRTSPAAILTGEPLPAPLGVATLLTTWRVDPLLLVVSLLLLAAVVPAIASGGMRAPRAASWVAGVLLLAWLTCGGLAVYRTVLLAAFLAQLAGLLLVVPLLLAAGAPAVPWRRVDPRIAAAVVAVVLIAVVGTGVLRWGVADPIGAEAVTLLLLLVGGLLAAEVVARRGRPRSPAVQAVAGLLAVEVATGVLLLLAPGLLQAEWFGAMGWGADAVAAQRAAAAGGLLVAVPATLVLLAAAVRPRPVHDSPADAAVLVRAEASA